LFLSQQKGKISIWIFTSFNAFLALKPPRKELEVQRYAGWTLGSKNNNLCEKALDKNKKGEII
jgi:hypothetical protein